MSALPPKADIGTQPRDVCFVPKADKVHRSKITLLDHLVSGDEQSLRHRDAERLRSLEINHQVEFRRLLDWEIGWLSAFQNLVYERSGVPIQLRKVRPITRKSTNL